MTVMVLLNNILLHVVATLVKTGDIAIPQLFILQDVSSVGIKQKEEKGTIVILAWVREVDR